MKKYMRVCARVNLDAVAQNMKMMKNNISKDTFMLAVLKSDGYGHGSVPIAKFLEKEPYLWGIAVATLDEACLLRKRGIQKPILVLGVIFPDQYEAMIEQDIRMTVYTLEMAQAVSDLAVKMNKDVRIHIKLDTGMSRLGFLIHEESVKTIAKICRLPHLIPEGMFTHFSKADEADKAFTNVQLEKYLWMKKRLLEENITFSYYHCSNSAGIIDLKEANMDLVRAGISMYGLYPSDEVKKERVPLIPALELISHVSHVKWVDAGTPVSYGGTFITQRRTRIATIPVGYGDGYPRSLSNKGYVLIHGKKAPILGRICMDQFMVDVTEIDDVSFGTKATLIGKDGDAFLPVETLSALSGRFSYEFVCDLNKRIPREYLKDGKVIEQIDYFS